MTAIDTRLLYRPLSEELLRLLRGLRPGDWERPATPAWSVRDVAAHILDGDLRRLSFQRDQLPLPQPEAPIEGYSDLLGLLDRLNADWVNAASRLSPRVLVDLLAVSGAQVAELMESQDLEGKAFFEVAWAGEHQTEAWLDIGRDFTEKWHHQQQIRLATGERLLTDERWLRPVLALSMLALPRAYEAVTAPEGTAVAIEIAGTSGGSWQLRREAIGWRIHSGSVAGASARVRLDQDSAWRLFFKLLPEEEAGRRIQVEGDPVLGAVFRRVRAVMV